MASEKEELQLLKIFPNEVWGLILENVKEVKDYHKISSASPHLRDRLLPRAPQVLFPEVFKILTERIGEDEAPTYWNPNPDHFRWIQTRKVCRAWKRGMDKVLQTQTYFLQDADQKLSDSFIEGIDVDDKPVLADAECFRSVAHFTRFEEHFDPTHLNSGANPFLRRKVQLSFKDRSGESYFAACLQFLEKYGHHVWFCILRGDFREPEILADFYCERLSAILELMPNCRALHLQNDLYQGLPTDVEAVPVPLPKLPNLDYIYFSGPPRVVVQELLRANPQVQHVDALRSAVRINLILESLPNLCELSIALAGNSEEVEEFYEAKLTSRVERMWLDMRNHWSSPSDLVFHALERHFSKSLVELHLCLTNYYDDVRRGAKLVLPNLKVLFLEMEEPKRLDFLLPLKESLEELHLAMGCEPSVLSGFECVELELEEHESDKKYEFKVYTVWKELQKSNIWKMFPKLRLLEIRVFQGSKFRCTRKKWQAEMKAQEMEQKP